MLALMTAVVMVSVSLAAIPSMFDERTDYDNNSTFGALTIGGPGTYDISDEADLRTLEEAVNSGNAMVGYTFVMTQSFEVSTLWIPIGKDNGLPFNGTFDGDGYTISGLTVDISGVYEPGTADAYAGLFGYIGSDGMVMNVNMASSCSFTQDWGSVNSGLNTNIFTGSIAGLNKGTILNCSNAGTVSTSYTRTAGDSVWNYEITAGGAVGFNEGTVDGFVNTGDIYSATEGGPAEWMNSIAGGVAGWNIGTIQNSSNAGYVEAWAESSFVYLLAREFARAGGIAGYNNGGVYYSNNSGEIRAASEVTDSFSVWSGNRPSAESNAGGIVGYNEVSGIIKGCYNTGLIKGETYPYEEYPPTYISNGYLFVGGICGLNIGLIEDCYNLGNIIAEGNNVMQVIGAGGIAGFMDDPGAVIKNCYNVGDITAENNAFSTNGWIGGVGGIVGNLDDGTVVNCYNKGNLEFTSDSYTDVGGIAGSISVWWGAGVISLCYWYDGADQIVNGSGQSKVGVGYNGSPVSPSTLMFDATEKTDILDALNLYVDTHVGDLEGWVIIATVNDGFPVFGSSVVTVTFDPDNGDPTWDVFTLKGDTVPEPTLPLSKTKLTFGDIWYLGGEVWNFGDSVNDNITLVAKYLADVTLTSDTDASFEYTIDAWTTSVPFSILAGGSYTVILPEGTQFEIKLTSDHAGYDAVWDDGTATLCASVYKGEAHGHMDIALTFTLPEEDNTLINILLAAAIIGSILLLLFMIWRRRTRIVGYVRHDGNGVADVAIEYTIERKKNKGEPIVGSVTTDLKGGYVIFVRKEDEVTIVSVAKEGYKTLSVKLTIEEKVTERDFDI